MIKKYVIYKKKTHGNVQNNAINKLIKLNSSTNSRGVSGHPWQKETKQN